MIARKKNSILIIDTNIFLTGIDFNLFEGEIYTTDKILAEINVPKYKVKNRTILNRFQAALDSGKLRIKNPSKRYIELVKQKSVATGDLNVLSKADFEIIALTLELGKSEEYDVKLYTNDYSMQNLSTALGIKFESLFKEGIKHEIDFEVYCPYCEIIYDSKFLNTPCERCGLKLKRRSKSK